METTTAKNEATIFNEGKMAEIIRDGRYTVSILGKGDSKCIVFDEPLVSDENGNRDFLILSGATGFAKLSVTAPSSDKIVMGDSLLFADLVKSYSREDPHNSSKLEKTSSGFQLNVGDSAFTEITPASFSREEMEKLQNKNLKKPEVKADESQSENILKYMREMSDLFN